MAKLFYIDPQSENSLAEYDYCLLSGIKNKEIFFLGRNTYNRKALTNAVFRPIFSYGDKKGIMKGISYIMSLKTILNYVKIERPSILHIQWLRIPRLDYLFYSYLQRKYKVKIVFTAHNILPHDSQNKYKRLFSKFYNMVDAIIVHTIRTKDELVSLLNINAEKIHVIPHGILLPTSEDQFNNANIEKINQKYSIRGKLVFSMLGVLSPYKGCDLVAEVWAKTPELHNGPSVLVIAGKNSNIDLSSIKNFKNVIIDERLLPNDEYEAFLRRSDVVLLPYRKISQSGVLLSAIGTRTPVLVSDIGGLTEPFDIADIGWVIETATFDNLRDALLRLQNNPTEVYQKKNNKESWRQVQEYYDWTNISAKTECLYNKLI